MPSFAEEQAGQPPTTSSFDEDLARLRAGSGASTFDADLARLRASGLASTPTSEPLTPATMPRTQAYHDERAAALKAQEPPRVPAVARGFTQTAGLLTPGTIDLATRPPVQNPDGTVSTVRSISVNLDGKEVLIPTVVNGRVVSDDEAIQEYRRTGQHLGIFDTPANATTFAQQLHANEAAKTVATPPPPAGLNRMIGQLPQPVPEEMPWHPIAGLKQVAQGATNFAKEIPAQIKHSLALSMNPGAGPWGSDAQRDAVSDMIEGTFEVVKPAIALAVATHPIVGGTSLAVSALAARGTYKAATEMGATPAQARLAANLAVLTVTGVATKKILTLGRTAVDSMAADARSVRAQAAAFDAAHPETPVQTEPVPVGRGATPAAAEATPKLEAVNEVLPPSPEPGAPPPPPPVLDTAAAVRDLATVAPNSPEAQTAFAALQRAGWDVPRIEQALAEVRSAGPINPDTAAAAVTPPPATGPINPAAVSEFEKDLADLRASTAVKPMVSEPMVSEGTSPAATHDFSSTQINLPPDTAAAIKEVGASIAPADLADKGVENEPHVTVKYGLHTADPAEVRELLKDEPPITVTLGKTSVFPNTDNGDVLKVDVDSADLHRLNAKIAEALPNSDEHPDYTPHATIAYLKPGLGEQYAGNTALEGHTVTVDRVTFSGKDGKTEEIPLTGAPTVTIGATSGPAQAAETAAPAPAGPIPASGDSQRPVPPQTGVQPPPRRQTRRRVRAQDPDAENAALDDVIAHAQAHGFAGDPAPLRKELLDRLQLIRELDAEFADSGRSPDALLRAIAQAGGLSVGEETGLKGELRWLKEFQDRTRGTRTRPGYSFGQVRGVQGVFNESGVSVDRMLELLRQEPRFTHLESVNSLLDEIRRAATATPDKDAVEQLVKGLGGSWWERIGTATPSADDEDVSFDPAQLEAAPPTADRLATGEEQPRLPGASEARQVGKADVTFKAPVQATGEDFELTGADLTTKEPEPNLFTRDLEALRKKDEPSFSRAPADPFYSALTRAAENLPQAKGTPEQMLAMLTKAKGVKQEELAWSGITPWLEGQTGTVTRAAIVDYLRANELHVEETLRGGNEMGSHQERFAAAQDALVAQAVTEEIGQPFEYAYDVARHHLSTSQQELMSAAMRPLAKELRAAYIERSWATPQQPTKFSQYTIPGGEEYRELLLTLPQPKAHGRRKAIFDKYTAELTRLNQRVLAVTGQDRQEAMRTRDILEQRRDIEADAVAGTVEPVFRSGHFEESNVVAHVRFNDRVDQEGQPVLFVEEVQSDWHQKGRKEGYAKPDLPDADVMRLLDDAGYTAQYNGVNWVVTAKDGSDVPNRLAGSSSSRNQFAGNLAQVAQMVLGRHDLMAGFNAVPDAPFKTTWPELAVKRVIRYAAEHGYARVAWTTGAVQNERYDLSKHVDEIRYRRKANGRIQMSVWKDRLSIDRLERSDITPAELEGLVGKDIANRMAQGEGTPTETAVERRLHERGRVVEIFQKADSEYRGGWYQRFANGEEHGVWNTRAQAQAETDRLHAWLDEEKDRSLTGPNLAVGGHGMRGFYDHLLPFFLNKFGKPFGARVGKTHLKAEGQSLANNDEASAAAVGAKPVHSIDITPSMREAALEGLPLFHRRLFTQDLLPTTKPDLIEALTDHPGLASFPQYQKLMTAFNLKFADEDEPSTVVRDLDAMPYPPSVRGVEELYDITATPKAPRTVTYTELRAQQGLSSNAKAPPRSLVTLGANVPAGLRDQAREQNEILTRTYLDMPTVRIAGRAVALLDAGGRFTAEELDTITSSPAVAKVVVALMDVLNDVIKKLGLVRARHFDTAGIERIGIVFDKRTYGVFLPRPLSITRQRRSATILLNPFELMYDAHGRGRPSVTPRATAKRAYQTAVHEALHWNNPIDGPEFEQQLIETLTALGDEFEANAIGRIKRAYADVDHPREYAPELREVLPLYTASRGRQGTTRDALSTSGRRSTRPPDESGPEDESVGDLRPRRSDAAAGPTVALDELQRLADRKGTTLDVQRQRARDAGYTILDEPRPATESAMAIGQPPPTAPPRQPTATRPRPPPRPVAEPETLGPTAALKSAMLQVTEGASGVRALWAPDSVSVAAGTQAAVMRAQLAVRRQRDARARKTMRALELAFDRIPQDQQLAFAYAVDEGRIPDLPPWQQAAAQVMTRISAAYRREANAIGGKVGYIEHYYPREWLQPGQVKAFIMRALYGRRPLQGRGGFKKHRTRDKETGDPFTFRQMHADFGFEPVSYNPVTAHLRKWTEMNKWIAARRILLEGKRYGISKYVKSGDKPPEGWVRYPDSFGTVYGPPVVKIKEAYDAGLMEALHRFAEAQGITVVRRIALGGQRWGYFTKKAARAEIHTKFGGPEGILMHEIGHALDHSHRLGELIGLAQLSERREEINFNETPTKVLKELRALADLRADLHATPSYKQYIRQRDEQLANLVHAFLYAPDLAKKVAPNAYWALFNLVKDTPDLHGLFDIQKARSLRFGVNTAEARVAGRVIAGMYYGPPDAVRLMENHLSPGLRGNVAFDLYRRAGNALNQVQLGLSAFHFLMTSLDDIIGKSGMVLAHASRGEWTEAAKKAVLVPIAPIADVMRGHQYLKEFHARDANFSTLTHVADAVARGGGGVGWDTFWHNSGPERFMQALRATVAEAKAGHVGRTANAAASLAWRAVPALIEVQAKPIMEWWVPRLKIAAYMDLYRMELANLGPEPDELQLRKVAQTAWATVDNWLGELIYDNLFWHAILRDAGMGSVRALGWNLGTVRGAIGATPKQLANMGLLPGSGAGGGGIGKPPRRLVNTGARPDPEGGPDIPIYEEQRAPWLTHDFARLVSLIFWVGVFGAIYQYLHTGLRPGEEQDGSTDASTLLLDLYFPRTGGTTRDGRPERASLPSYMKDLYAASKHPITTAQHKLHPLLAMMADILRNEDYYGTEIRNPDDPFLTKLADIFTFAKDAYKPISLKNYYQRQASQKKGSAIGFAESLLGIGVAPATVNRTALEEYMHDVSPPTHRTKAQAAQAAARREFRDDLNAGDLDHAIATAQAANLSKRQVLAAAHSARRISIQRSFQSLSIDQAIHGYELATPEERLSLQGFLESKARRLIPDAAPADRARLTAAMLATRSLPVAGERLSR